MLKVRDIMTSKVVCVPSSAPIMEVAQKMRDSGTGVIPVCDNGKFRGIITERDIVIGIVARGYDPKREHASTLVNNHYPMISSGEEIMRAAKVMIDHGVRVLPVAHNGKLLGLFGLDDLARESPALGALVSCKTTKPQASRETEASWPRPACSPPGP